MEIRNLHYKDLKNSQFRTQFCEMLNAPILSEEQAISVFNQRIDTIVTLVGLDDDGMPIATASIVMEKKFIYNGIVNGHIEDVAVHPNHQRKGLGTEIMTHAMTVANRRCERIVLECKPELKTFYETHGFQQHSIAMKKMNV